MKSETKSVMKSVMKSVPLSRQPRMHTSALLCLVIALSSVIGTGILRAFTRGGNDFTVFYKAWSLVLEGRGSEIYRVSPDRFLYAPGFAWVLSPLAFLPHSIALGVWCAIKVAVLVGFVFLLTRSMEIVSNARFKSSALPAVLLGLLVISKPLLIDLEYGQVNLLILGSVIWASLTHLRPRSAVSVLLSWTCLSFVAFGKVFPLPLLLLPWLIKSEVAAKTLRMERIGIFLGFGLSVLSPGLQIGTGISQLWQDWLSALLSRGLPLESHNQSFSALLHHYFSGVPTEVRALGPSPMLMGAKWISTETIALVSSAWTFTTMGFLLGWLISGDAKIGEQRIQWLVVLVALLIVPSHLVWKPYFVLSAPLVAYFVWYWLVRSSVREGFLLFLVFVGINFTGFDFIGIKWGSHFEAASFLLIFHLVLIGRVMFIGPIESWSGGIGIGRANSSRPAL